MASICQRILVGINHPFSFDDAMSTITPLTPVDFESQPVLRAPTTPLAVPESEQSIVVQCEPSRSRMVTAKIIGRSPGEPNVILAESER